MLWIAALTLVFLVMLALSLRTPAWFIGPLYCMFAFEQALQSQSRFLVERSSFMNLVIAGIVLLLLAYHKAKGHASFKTGPVLLGTVALVVLSIASIAWSIDPAITKRFFVRDIQLFLLITVAVALLIRSMEDAWVAIKSVLIFSVVASVAIMQSTDVYLRQIVLAGQVAQWGSQDTASGNPLEIASVAGYAAILTLVIPFRKLGVVWTIGRFALFAVCLLAIIRTGSRGQLATALLVSLLAYFLANSNQQMGKKMLAALGSVVVLGLIVFVLGQYARGDRWDFSIGAEVYADSRLTFALDVIAYWQEAGPIAWLIGIGSAAARSPLLLDGFYTHIVVVEVLAELGILGFSILAYIGWRTVYYLRHLMRVCGPSSVMRCTVVGWASLLFFDFILSFKQGTMLGTPRLFAGLLVVESMAYLVSRGRWALPEQSAAVQDLSARPGLSAPAAAP